MRSFVIVGVLGLLAGCSSSDEPATASADSATDSQPTDSSPIDSALLDAATDSASSLTCDPTGGLAAPAIGQAVIEATFSEAADGYNGSTAPFTGVAMFGSTDPDAARFISYNKAPSVTDATVVQLIVGTGPLPTACQSYKTADKPVASYPYFEYYTGPMGRIQFVCGGAILVDTVVGNSYTFHFDVRCVAKPVLDGMGSVRLIGKGAGVRKPKV